MEFFQIKENRLVFRYDGECVMLTSWGKDAFRVQSSILSDINEESVALQKPEDFSEDAVRIAVSDERHAVIQNGRITAELFVQEWGNALQITYKNQKDEILLREITNGGALARKARKFRALPGGNFRLKVSFEAGRSSPGIPRTTQLWS